MGVLCGVIFLYLLRCRYAAFVVWSNHDAYITFLILFCLLYQENALFFLSRAIILAVII
jgi:hypothetical protein